jgi:predicted permease
LNSLLRDIRFAQRSLGRAPVTTIVALTCLALGIGANTAIFSVVQGVLLSSLPYRDPSRLVRMNESFLLRGARTAGSVSPPNYLEWRAQTRVFEDVAAWRNTTIDLGDVAEPERLRGVRATANLFKLLGSSPLVGRTFLPEEEGSPNTAVVVISEGLWRRRFAADPHMLDSSITLGGTRHAVIGIMPAAFDFPVSPLRNDVWLPMDWRSFGAAAEQRGARSLQVVARLAPGVDSARAMAELGVVSARLERDYPRWQTGRGILLSSLSGTVSGDVRRPLLILLGACGLVLVIACANVASLLLARAASRRREIAVRTALGAARTRLIRQLLTESVLLGGVGGALGLAVAGLGVRALRGLSHDILPRSESITVSVPVLLLALGTALLTGIVVGLAPALRASRADLQQDLSEASGGTRTTAGAQRHRTLRALVVGQIALSFVLVVGAGLVIRSFLALLANDPGFRPNRVLAFHVGTPPIGVTDSVRYTAFYAPLLERLRTIPGVNAAGFTTLLPIQDGAEDRYFSVLGRPEEADPSKRPSAQVRYVSSQYFRALGIDVLSGREFGDDDRRNTEPVVVVNDELARRYFPGENPIGQRMYPGTGAATTIIGVVRSVRQLGLDQAPRAEFYVAASQSHAYGSMAYVVSTQGDPAALAGAVRDAVRSIAPQQPVYQLATMTAVISQSLSRRRLVLALLGAVSGLALALASAGVYGVMSFGVSQRVRELGVRMALGARGTDVLSMVLRETARVIGAGVVIGVTAALILTRLLEGMLYGVSARDPLTFAPALLVIAVSALAAGLMPALRASRLDPLVAMRAE